MKHRMLKIQLGIFSYVTALWCILTQQSGLTQIPRPSLKIHNNEEGEEPQGESTHHYSDHPVSQAAKGGVITKYIFHGRFRTLS